MQIISREQVVLLILRFAGRKSGAVVVVMIVAFWVESEGVDVLCGHAGIVNVGKARMPDTQAIHVLGLC